MKILKEYIVDGIIYPLEITYKRKRNYSYNYDGKYLKAYVPFNANEKLMYSHLEKHAKKLIDRYQKSLNSSGNELYKNKDGYVYLYGDISNHLDISELYQKEYDHFLNLLKSRVELYKLKMNISRPYEIKLSKRALKSKFGTNKAKKVISFNIVLIHFDINIIDSVVIHELVHDKYFNHSQSFYNMLYKYCPNYDKYRKCLLKRIYRYEQDYK